MLFNTFIEFFVSEGSFDEKGDYLAKIVDTFEQDGKEEEVVTQ